MSKNNLTQEQQAQLQQIGSNLQNIRLDKGISLDTVAANTKIALRLLQAIETGDSNELPEPFYIKALVAKFAQEIGAQDLEFDLSSGADTEIAPPHTTKKTPRRYWFNFQLRSLHLYLLYTLLVLISVKGITMLVERPIIINQSPDDQPTIKAETTQSQAPATPTPLSSAAPPQFISQSSDSKSVTVGINLQERCWLKVMVDGEMAFEGILPKGTHRQWSGKQQVTIRAGNAGGVVISFNNQQEKVLGAPGQVEEITYTVN